MPRAIAALNASRPKTVRLSHSFSAREPRLSCGPRSRNSTTPPCGVAQVGAVERERALEQPGLADEDGADLVRLEEPLVRVEHERVGALDAGEEIRLDEPGGRAVRAVDVEPQVLAVAQVGEIVERIDGAGAGRAGRADDAERRQPDLAVDVQRGVDRGGLEPVVGVGAQDAQVGRVEAEHAPRLQDRAVRVLGDVPGGLVTLVAAMQRARRRAR